MAAHEGTATGLGAALGVEFADGLGVGESAGLGDELATTEGDGLLCEAAGAALPQPQTASMTATAASLNPTWD
ncbi:MAG TPA: hypothetical protein VLR46_13530 [Candidatus Dormibacteraeota bacterium]|nr:hypothetical protein [Candidatus Dormibacteraeota bacterium]